MFASENCKSDIRATAWHEVATTEYYLDSRCTFVSCDRPVTPVIRLPGIAIDAHDGRP